MEQLRLVLETINTIELDEKYITTVQEDAETYITNKETLKLIVERCEFLTGRQTITPIKAQKALKAYVEDLIEQEKAKASQAQTQTAPKKILTTFKGVVEGKITFTEEFFELIAEGKEFNCELLDQFVYVGDKTLDQYLAEKYKDNIDLQKKIKRRFYCVVLYRITDGTALTNGVILCNPKHYHKQGKQFMHTSNVKSVRTFVPAGKKQK